MELAKTGGMEVQQFYRDPSVALEEASKAARALKAIVDAKPPGKIFKVKGETYLQFEDWQTVASFYQHTVKTRSYRLVEIAGATGFEAEAVVLDPLGREVSSAVMLCMNDEENWGKRPVYEWQFNNETKKRERVKVREEQVPLFQLLSMAQTRAGAKALRMRFSFVVVLAGYAAVAREEVEGTSTIGEGEAEEQGDAGEKEARHPQGTRLISEGMQKKIYAVLNEMGVKNTEEKPNRQKEYCQRIIGGKAIEHFGDLSFDEGRKLIDSLEGLAAEARSRK